MATLLSNAKLGNTGVSGLLKSALTISNEINTYKDAQAAQDYALSAKTADDLATYQSHLQDRIKTLNSSGSVTDATKALSLTNSLYSAIKANGSSDIQRENIQIMAGNATLQDKYNAIVGQYTRAVGIGDLALAQSLESQAYSVSQSIQYQAQQSASAASALREAGASTEGNIVTNLTDSIKYFEGIAKNGSESDLNQASKDFVTKNADVLKSYGVKIGTDQPNYFDVVTGLVGAAYTNKVLQAQAETAVNPLTAKNYAMDAAEILNGTTKFDTLAGSKTFQQIQSLSMDPRALAFDSETGTYKTTTQVGFQYENQITSYDKQGNPQYSQVLAPQYSGIIGGTPSSKVYFLTPNETKAAVNLGLNFTQTDVNSQVAAGHQVGAGVEVQATEKTPAWLKSILGENGVTKIFSDNNGNITFGTNLDSASGKFYTLTQDAKGLSGLYEHSPNGSTNLVGGDYGFNAGAAQLLINQGQQIQQQISVAQQSAAAQAKALTLSAPKPLSAITIAPVAPPAASISVPRSGSSAIVPPASPIQRPTVNPQTAATTGSGINVQGGNNFNLLTSGGGGIRL